MTIPTGTDSRCRPTVKITGTKTFRYAYADPALQQYPPEIRHLFQAKPGCVFIAADYSQLEARILAYLSRDAISIEAFTQNEDVHAQNARDLFGFTLDYWQRLEPTKKKAHRNFAKSFLYRISYGGEGQTDKSKTYCPCDKCQQYQPQSLNLKRNEILTSEARWFATHHWVRTFQDNLCRSVQQNHYYDSPFGLRRWISKPWGNDLRREVLNVPMQMNAALLMNQSQVLLHKMGLPIILQIHDAFMVEVPDNSSVIEQCIADMVGVMERPIEAFGGAVFPVDVEVGQNWGSNSMENPNGLKGVEVNGE
jgi:DNA polymerase-1